MSAVSLADDTVSAVSLQDDDDVVPDIPHADNNDVVPNLSYQIPEVVQESSLTDPTPHTEPGPVTLTYTLVPGGTKKRKGQTDRHLWVHLQHF